MDIFCSDFPQMGFRYHSDMQTGQCCCWYLPCDDQLPFFGLFTSHGWKRVQFYLPAHYYHFLSILWKRSRYDVTITKLCSQNCKLILRDNTTTVCFILWIGGTLLIVRGFGFSEDTKVTIGSKECKFVDATDTEIICRSPAVSVLSVYVSLLIIYGILLLVFRNLW